MTMARIKIAAGANAWLRVLETDAIVRKSMLMTKVRKNEMSRKKKKAPGSRLKFVMKYSTRLKIIVFKIL